MGFTPLEGLVMASRAGSIDPGIPLWLIKHGLTAEEVNRALERDSGLRGLTGTGDMRRIRELAAATTSRPSPPWTSTTTGSAPAPPR